MTQNDVAVIGATQLQVGLSQIIRFVAGSQYYHGYLKILSGGGTLEVVDPQFSGTSTVAASPNGWGKGYPVGASEIIQFNGPATFYLAATGATMIAALMIGKTYGATTL